MDKLMKNKTCRNRGLLKTVIPFSFSYLHYFVWNQTVILSFRSNFSTYMNLRSGTKQNGQRCHKTQSFNLLTIYNSARVCNK